jgi:hypothetical protein
VIDAAGAIYVIGGRYLNTYFQDVWVSTDRGADRTPAGWSGEYTKGGTAGGTA